MEVTIINVKDDILVPTDSKKNRRESLLPVFVYEILTSDTSESDHCSQKFIRERLYESYGVDTSRRTVSRCVSSLCEEDLGIFGDSKEGYWYEGRKYHRV